MKDVHLFAIAILFSGSGWSYDITVYCVNDKGAKIKLENEVQRSVEFADGQYLLPSADYDYLTSECSMIPPQEMVKSMLGVAIRQYAGDKLSRYYPISPLEPHVIAHVKMAFNKLKEQHVIDLYAEDTKHLEKIEDSLSKINPRKLTGYIEITSQFTKDFPRSNWRIVTNDNVIYKHSKEGGKPIKAFVEIIESLSKFPNPVERQIDIKALRSRIALALETRTQTFDANVIHILHQFYTVEMPQFPVNVQGVDRNLHSVRVMKTKLYLETSGGVLISPILNGLPIPADLVRFHRSCEMDLKTGKLTKETIVFEKT